MGCKEIKGRQGHRVRREMSDFRAIRVMLGHRVIRGLPGLKDSKVCRETADSKEFRDFKGMLEVSVHREAKETLDPKAIREMLACRVCKVTSVRKVIREVGLPGRKAMSGFRVSKGSRDRFPWDRKAPKVNRVGRVMLDHRETRAISAPKVIRVLSVSRGLPEVLLVHRDHKGRLVSRGTREIKEMPGCKAIRGTKDCKGTLDFRGLPGHRAHRVSRETLVRKGCKEIRAQPVQLVCRVLKGTLGHREIRVVKDSREAPARRGNLDLKGLRVLSGCKGIRETSASKALRETLVLLVQLVLLVRKAQLVM